jgi:hypothetical protein
MLLLLAEAEVEAGSIATAMAIVNEIRTRAGMRAQGPGTDRPSTAVPIDDPSITWADYRIGLYPAVLPQAEARQAVRFERRLELAMEGQRFFDLRRWALADQNIFPNTLNGYVNGVAGGAEENRRPYLLAAEPIVAKHLLYPIPAIQIQLSRVGEQSMLTQNPGW